MSGRYLLIITGAFLVFFGIIFLNNCLDVLHVSGTTYSEVLRHLMVILPSCLIVSGLFAVLTGITKNKILLTLTGLFGLKFSIFVLLLHGAALLVKNTFLEPFYMSFQIQSVFGLPVAFISFLLIVLCVNLYITGIDYAEKLKYCIITISVTRILSSFGIIIFIYYYREEIKVFGNLNIIEFAFSAGISLLICEFIRFIAKDNSIISIIVCTVFSLIILGFFLVLHAALSKDIVWFYQLSPLIPVIGIGIVLFLTRKSLFMYGLYLLSKLDALISNKQFSCNK
jgi:hypothetical protein